MKLVTHYGKVNAMISGAFLRAVEETRGEAAMNVGVITGQMRASVSYTITGHLRARVGSSHRGAMMRERGGTIVPVRAKLLSWVDRTGQRRFAKRVVQLPGFHRSRTGRGPWLKPAGDKFPQFFEEHLRAAR